MNPIKSLLLIWLFILLHGCTIYQRAYTPGVSFDDTETLQQFLEEGHWRFDLSHVSGPYVPSNFNTYGYGFKVEGDSIHSYLPFFGVSHRAPSYGSNEGPLSFQSPIKSYTVNKDSSKYSDGLEVEIKTTKEPQNTIIYHLVVFKNGSAGLTMISTDTQSISFTGSIHRLDENENSQISSKSRATH